MPPSLGENPCFTQCLEAGDWEYTLSAGVYTEPIHMTLINPTWSSDWQLIRHVSSDDYVKKKWNFRFTLESFGSNCWSRRSTGAGANSAPCCSAARTGQLGDFLGGSCGGGFQCDQPQFSLLDVWTGSQSLLSHLHGRGTKRTRRTLHPIPRHEESTWDPEARRQRQQQVDGLNLRENPPSRGAAEPSCGLRGRFM